ncbi:hypothetical protein [Haloarcula pellucida]|uniref:Uncharacterized protein n=1 Tax=Haloarcula pellucida TaxID=1427151 RepID=A0A830GR03_9EURY|nr:hypothetical protein [Halomicroarcula pellucida]MBX0350480.1 hypothetical protein [Halomicroarcula pellucida]GGO03525.1 hypothetical protein GCM10009030_39260 [Halomicroarcula pellucida]
MTFWFDRDENELVGNNLGEFVTVEENGTVRIDVGGIMDEGRALDKLTSIQKSVVNAIVANAGGDD